MRGRPQQGPEKGQRWGTRVGQHGPRVRACKVKPRCVSVADTDKASNGKQNLSEFSREEARWLSQCRGAWAQGTTWNTPMGAASWPLR